MTSRHRLLKFVQLGTNVTPMATTNVSTASDDGEQIAAHKVILDFLASSNARRADERC